MQDSIVVAGGFLVPGKSTGAINLFTNVLNQPQGPFQISVNSFEYFYHEVRWKGKKANLIVNNNKHQI